MGCRTHDSAASHAFRAGNCNTEYLSLVKEPTMAVMTSSEIAREIRSIVAEILELSVDQITLDQTMNQLMQIDSVAMLEILLAIERRFGIDIQETELQGITNLEQVIDLIHRKVQQRANEA
jgi:acyl carrier protein